MHILVRYKGSGAEACIPLEQAARLMGLPADEIEAILEACGECEAGQYIALEPDYIPIEWD